MFLSLDIEARVNRLGRLVNLTKPKVVSLIVFTAAIGMFLSTREPISILTLVSSLTGIWLVAGAAAAVNCLVEHKIDSMMARTQSRASVTGDVSLLETMIFAGLVGGAGLIILFTFVNELTMWLTLLTFVGYAIIYTVVLKPLTPQNIVIGGASGAMPPVLGWAAVTGDVSHEALLLFLIIFVWTPPHFWSLALYRKEEYASAGVPMLPVTHGDRYTRLQVLLYTIILSAVSLLPFAVGMSGNLYFMGAILLNLVFLGFAIQICRNYSDRLARATFRYSIIYLALLFAFLLADHYFNVI